MDTSKVAQQQAYSLRALLLSVIGFGAALGVCGGFASSGILGQVLVVALFGASIWYLVEAAADKQRPRRKSIRTSLGLFLVMSFLGVLTGFFFSTSRTADTFARIERAIHGYESEHGSFPGSLEELVPRYLSPADLAHTTIQYVPPSGPGLPVTLVIKRNYLNVRNEIQTTISSAKFGAVAPIVQASVLWFWVGVAVVIGAIAIVTFASRRKQSVAPASY